MVTIGEKMDELFSSNNKQINRAMSFYQLMSVLGVMSSAIEEVRDEDIKDRFSDLKNTTEEKLMELFEEELVDTQ